MLSKLNEPHLSNFIIAEDKNGKYIKYGDKVKFDTHIGEIDYDFSGCRFIIRWLDDSHVRSLSSDFAKQIEVIDEI